MTNTERITNEVFERYMTPPEMNAIARAEIRIAACHVRAIVRYELHLAKQLKAGDPDVARWAGHALTHLEKLAEGVE